MKPDLKVFVAQLNPIVGALESNRALISDAYEAGVKAGADIVAVPELSVTGYPPLDLLDRPAFIDRNLEVRDALVGMTGETALIFGCVARNETGCGKPFYNVAVVAQNGKLLLQQGKSLLPTYDVFDELRYFEPAGSVATVMLHGTRVGVAICEDFWFEEKIFGSQLYCENPIDNLVVEGQCELLINISASPYNVGKRTTRHQIFRDIATRFSVPIVYVNQVGGNDELLFDGSSIVLDSKGNTIFCGRMFQSESTLVPLSGPVCDSLRLGAEEEEIAHALILGLKDYIGKCGFTDVVIGLSGGIDSAVTAALAVEALGASHVSGITMPSGFSSSGSVDDSIALAANLGIRCMNVPIADVYSAYRGQFDEMFGNTTFDVTDENVQARIRGNLLMAWSNKTGAMVLTTGNKSELAVGYCTLYGDMSGGLGLLGDVYKTTVYKIASWINRDKQIIPQSTMTKAPSAELRPGQKDQDTLPPYEILDKILKLYIEEWHEVDEIAARGFDCALVERILGMVDGNEFKRRQAAPTIRVSSKAFGSGRQMPIAQRWRRESSGRSE